MGPEPGTSLPPRPNKKTWHVRDIWLLLFSLASSVALLCALIGLLFVFDNKPIFDSGVVTLNTLIAILSTAYKACIVHSLGFVISQSKWIVFADGRRRLLDFDRIEAAGLGPLGSLHLLFNLKVSDISVVRASALLTVLAVAMDPFAQQLLQFRQANSFINDDSGNTNISRASRYAKGTETRISIAAIRYVEGNSTSLFGGSNIPITTDADFSMQSAMMYGLVQTPAAVSQQASFSCPSGNCVYPPFTSLSVCFICSDVTASIVVSQVEPGTRMNITLDRAINPPQIESDKIIRYSLPNGLYLDNSLEMTLRGSTNASRSLAFSNLTTLIWSQTILRHPPSTNITLLPLTSTNPGVSATECALYYCINTYNSTVTDGVLSESIRPSPNHTRDPASWSLLPDLPGQEPPVFPPSRQPDISYHPRFSYARRTDLSFTSPPPASQPASAPAPATPAGRYNLSQAAVTSISALAQRTFATCTTQTANCTTNLERVADNWTPLNGFYMTVRSGPQFELSAAQALWQAGSVEGVFDSVARRVSNALRAGADAGSGEGENVVLGMVGVVTVLYRVDWRWIGLHGLVVPGAVGAVVWVLAQSGRGRGDVPVWGASTLAVLAKGEEMAGLFRGAEGVAEMEGRARGVEVHLFGEQMVPRKHRGEESDDEAWRIIR